MPNTNWADLNRDGRRLEGIIRMLNTKVHKIAQSDDGDLNLMVVLASTMVKFTHEKVEIAKTVLRVDEITKVKPEQALKKVIEPQFIPV